MSESSDRVVDQLRATLETPESRAMKMHGEIVSLLKDPSFKDAMNALPEPTAESDMFPTIGEYQEPDKAVEIKFGRSGVEVITTKTIGGVTSKEVQRYAAWDNVDLVPTLSEEQKALGRKPDIDDDLKKLPANAEAQLNEIRKKYTTAAKS